MDMPDIIRVLVQEPPRIIRVLIPGPAGPPGPIGGDAIITVADLKARNLAVGETVRTLGYYVGGDGGESVYHIVAGATGAADDAFFINMANGNQAQLVLADPATMHVRQLGCIADGVTPDDARIAIGEASTVQNFNCGGLTVVTNRTANTQLLKNYFGGAIIGESSTSEDPTTGADNPVVVHPRWQIADTDIQRPRTKSPVVDWQDREVLANGTSITQEGGDVDSYFTLSMNAVGAHCTNMGWAGSAANFDENRDPMDVTTIKRLSMTEDDRQAGIAIHGPGSVYNDTDPINKASQMTCDYRIKRIFQTAPITVWFLDHNHNDRGKPPGTLSPESHTITAITKGTTTQFTLNAIGSIAVGSAVAVRVTGIAFLDYAAARVQAVAGNVVTLNINSSAYAGTFSSGSIVILDRKTIFGAWEFLIYYAKNCAIVFGTGELAIILCTAPSEYTNGMYTKEIFSIGTYIKRIAAKWSAAVFDGAYEYDVKLGDQPVYFEDLIHPTTVEQRQAYANHIVKWCMGGAVKVADPDAFLPSGSPNYIDDGIATYSEFAQGFGTFTRFFGAPVEKLRQDFSAGLLDWTVTGPAPVLGVSPWSPSEQAALLTATAATPSNYISHALTLGKGREIHCTFSLPNIDNLCAPGAPVPASVTLLQLRSSGSYYVFNFVIRNPSGVSTRMQYFETPNTTLHNLGPAPSTMIAETTRYDVIIKCYQGTSSTDPGRMLIYINGALAGGPYELTDFGQTAIASLRIGAIGSNTGQSFQVHVGNIVAYDLPETDTPPYKITYLAPGGTLPIPLDDKLDEVVSVTGWMTAPYDAAADHTSWLLNVIDKVHSQLGGADVGIYMPHPLYNVSATIGIPYDHVNFIGRGGGEKRNSPTDTRASALTRIFYTGTAAVPVVEWAPSAGAQYGGNGGGMRDIMIDGGNKASRGLSILSTSGLKFDFVHVYAAIQAMIFSGCWPGTFTAGPSGAGDYSSKNNVWLQCFAHASGLSANVAYAMHLTGGQGAGGTNAGNTCFNRFELCNFVSRNNHAVRMENTDSNFFIGGAMSSEVGGAVLAGGLVTGFGGLELCSSAQSGGFGNAVARHATFSQIQINDLIVRAAQAAGGNSPNHIEIFGNNFANAGGTVLVETPAGGAPPPHLTVYDCQNGLRVFGNSVFPYQLRGIDRIHLIDGVGLPAAEVGYAKLFVDSADGDLKIRFGDGTIKTIVVDT